QDVTVPPGADDQCVHHAANSRNTSTCRWNSASASNAAGTGSARVHASSSSSSTADGGMTRPPQSLTASCRESYPTLQTSAPALAAAIAPWTRLPQYFEQPA